MASKPASLIPCAARLNYPPPGRTAVREHVTNSWNGEANFLLRCSRLCLSAWLASRPAGCCRSSSDRAIAARPFVVRSILSIAAIDLASATAAPAVVPAAIRSSALATPECRLVLGAAIAVPNTVTHAEPAAALDQLGSSLLSQFFSVTSSGPSFTGSPASTPSLSNLRDLPEDRSTVERYDYQRDGARRVWPRYRGQPDRHHRSQLPAATTGHHHPWPTITPPRWPGFAAAVDT